MRLHNVTVSREDIGWHGIGSADVVATTATEATIDLSTWVDEHGVGESATGAPVEKRFPSTVVLLANVDLDTTTYARHAETAYIGVDGAHECDTYRAAFDDVPPPGLYETFFPHQTTRVSDARTTAHIEPVEYSKDEVVDLVVSE